MAYCRFSTDNFSCDIYAYEHVSGGFQIHIAANRVVGEIPKVGFHLIAKGKHEEYLKQHQKQMEFLVTCKREPINLKYSGEGFRVETLQEFKDKMIELRGIGYSFPDYVLEDIDKEITHQTGE